MPLPNSAVTRRILEEIRVTPGIEVGLVHARVNYDQIRRSTVATVQAILTRAVSENVLSLSRNSYRLLIDSIPETGPIEGAPIVAIRERIIYLMNSRPNEALTRSQITNDVGFGINGSRPAIPFVLRTMLDEGTLVQDGTRYRLPATIMQLRNSRGAMVNLIDGTITSSPQTSNRTSDERIGQRIMAWFRQGNRGTQAQISEALNLGTGIAHHLNRLDDMGLVRTVDPGVGEAWVYERAVLPVAEQSEGKDATVCKRIMKILRKTPKMTAGEVADTLNTAQRNATEPVYIVGSISLVLKKMCDTRELSREKVAGRWQYTVVPTEADKRRAEAEQNRKPTAWQKIMRDDED